MAKNFYDILGISSPAMRKHFEKSDEILHEVESKIPCRINFDEITEMSNDDFIKLCDEKIVYIPRFYDGMRQILYCTKIDNNWIINDNNYTLYTFANDTVYMKIWKNTKTGSTSEVPPVIDKISSDGLKRFYINGDNADCTITDNITGGTWTTAMRKKYLESDVVIVDLSEISDLPDLPDNLTTKTVTLYRSHLDAGYPYFTSPVFDYYGNYILIQVTAGEMYSPAIYVIKHDVPSTSRRTLKQSDFSEVNLTKEDGSAITCYQATLTIKNARNHMYRLANFNGTRENVMRLTDDFPDKWVDGDYTLRLTDDNVTITIPKIEYTDVLSLYNYVLTYI